MWNILHEQMGNDVIYFCLQNSFAYYITNIVCVLQGQIASKMFLWCLQKYFHLLEFFNTNINLITMMKQSQGKVRKKFTYMIKTMIC